MHPHQEVPVNMASAKILVVDDDAFNRVLITEGLESRGYEVHQARDGVEAVSMIENTPFDLILLDLVMPNMDGFGVLERMKADFRLCHIPVIVISSDNDMKNILLCIEAGAADYLPKPFSPLLLELRVRNAVQHTPSMCAIRQRAAKVLVVDDDAVNRLMLASNLEENGHAVRMASGGEEALQILKGEEFDLILLDLVMQDMGGHDVLRWIRADVMMRLTPVIIVSGQDDSECIAQCIEAGATDHISKPFDPIVLNARVNASLAERRLRLREASYMEMLKEERKNAEKLLLNILPKKIADRLKHGEDVIADGVEDATVMFADLVNFTQLTRKLKPKELVTLLNRIFSAFDLLSEKHGVEKIKTIGDCYMAVGGLPEPRDGHAESTVHMAIDMMKEIDAINAALGMDIRIRIGIHCGPVMAGVIGSRKFTYDLWGDTVNIAQRIESHGLPGRIQTSHAVYERLKGTYRFMECGMVTLKGIGDMPTYLVEH